MESDWNDFQQAVKLARKSCKGAYNNFVRKIIAPNSKQNPKRFFSYIKSKKNENVGVSPLLENGVIKITDTDKARILNKQFCSVFSIDDGVIPILNSRRSTTMEDIKVHSDGIRQLLKDLNPFKAKWS